ncbi:unnamed protein product, partial [Aphanomyces euteiches]
MAKDKYYEAKAEWRQECLDSGFDHHANLNERSSTHFFRRSPSVKIPINEASTNGRVT